jgi:CheY-like chemotaxis protein
MSILVLESDPAQIETIRHIVCNVLGTELMLVGSIDEAVEALHATTPDIVLLPALVSPAEEAKLVTFLREHPHGAYIETLFTPVIAKKENSTESSRRGWLRWLGRRSASEAAGIDETTLFTERLTLSLRSVRERRERDEELITALDSVDKRSTPHEAVAPATANEEIAGEAVTDVPMPSAPEEPVAPSAAAHEDRRTHPRFQAHELQALHASRVAGGPSVNVRDVSVGGALLESEMTLENDFGVLEIVTSMLRAHYVPFRVVRRQVETDGTLTRYVEACAFLEPLDVSGLHGGEEKTDADPDGLAALKALLDPYLTGPASADRRRHVRVDGPFDGYRRGRLDMPILIHNLSQGGCFVDSRLDVDPGHSLVLGLRTVDGALIDVAGEVVHKQSGIGFAVRFSDVSDTVRDELARIIAERSAGVDGLQETA